MTEFGSLGKSFLMLAIFVTGLIPMNAQTPKPEDQIIARERASLDRWKAGDTFGFVDIAADEITYFDPEIEKRCDGIQAFRDYMASFRGTFSFPSYELLNPKVQLYGDIGVLTFNFVGYSKEGKRNRWNTTEVYRLIKGEWRLASSNWSHTKP